MVTKPEYRYYTVSQAGLIPIDVVINGQTVHLGVESYEECDMRLDPRINDENPGLNGLQWGWTKTDFTTGNYNLTSTTDGIGNTKKMINYEFAGNIAFDGVDVNSLYNNYAARYCYNKNRRNNDGTVIEESATWYLPAIDELIPLTNSITTSSALWTPTNMTGKEYWSSTVPTFIETEANPLTGILGAIWDLLSYLFRSDSGDYYYTKVAKGAQDGDELKTMVNYDYGIFGDVDVPFFNPRTGKKHVRAVRIMP